VTTAQVGENVDYDVFVPDDSDDIRPCISG